MKPGKTFSGRRIGDSKTVAAVNAWSIEAIASSRKLSLTGKLDPKILGSWLAGVCCVQDNMSFPAGRGGRGSRRAEAWENALRLRGSVALPAVQHRLDERTRAGFPPASTRPCQRARACRAAQTVDFVGASSATFKSASRIWFCRCGSRICWPSCSET